MQRIQVFFKIKLKIICSFIFIFLSQNIKAEKNKNLNKQKQLYSIKPSALNIGIDIFTPSFSYIKYGSSFHNYSVNTSIDFNRIFLDLDFGILRYHKKQPFVLNEKYQMSKGGISQPTKFDDSAFNLNLKLGFSYNFLHKNKEHNSIFAGFGYNIAYCKNKLNGELIGIGDSKIYSENINTETQNFFIHWFDIVLGLRMTVFNNFYLGHTTHLNIFKTFLKKNNTCLIPYFISGYGPEENSYNIKFSFFIGYNIPLFKDPKLENKD